MGTLFIVATPIGNLKDITLRAIEVLQTVEIIAAEDTRKTSFLLQSISSMYDISIYHTQSERKKVTLLSYYEQNELQRIPEIIALLHEGKHVALVSDAGTPTISDPGYKLVRECIHQGIKVEAIPGPSSVIAALVSSGLPTDKFFFLGYLPKKAGKRKKILEELLRCYRSLEHAQSTIIFFEAPHRVVQSLEALQEVFGDIEIVLARELTKVHEEVSRKKVSEHIAEYQKKHPKGEFILLFSLKDI